MSSRIRSTLVTLLTGTLLTVAALCGSAATTEAAPPGGARYAVLISGGNNPLDNGSRFWNDCAYFYTTLKQNGFTDENIYVIFSDGLDPSNDSLTDGFDDQHKFYYWMRSSPFDLDGDNRPDIRFEATRASVTAVFNELANRVGPHDILYIFATDHGGATPDNPLPYAFPSSTMSLWNGAKLTADEMAAEVDKVKAGAIVGIFEMCNSGGFVEQLAAPNRVLMSAARWWETSRVKATRDYDEFAYYAILALADPTRGDASGDGITSIEETYLFALAHDAWQSNDVWYSSTDGEHPSYYSNPWDLGRRLSLQGRIRRPSPPVSAGFVEKETGERYPRPGVPQGWHAHDGVWDYRLPFSFPFGGATYDTAHITSKGIIYFANPSTSGDNSVSGLAAATAIAPLWGNLTTADPDTDIYLDADKGQVTVSWVARSASDGRPVNVAARLQRNGVITFFYGPGNDLTSLVGWRDKTIGVSLGDGSVHYSLRNGASSLTDARTVSFVPVRPKH